MTPSSKLPTRRQIFGAAFSALVHPRPHPSLFGVGRSTPFVSNNAVKSTSTFLSSSTGFTTGFTTGSTTGSTTGPDGFVSLSDVDRIYCLSDLHTDNDENMDWIRSLSSRTKEDGVRLTQRDLVVVAGDISHRYGLVRDTLRTLRQSCRVFFVCGNHEAWMNRDEPALHSLEKMERIKDICQEEGVYTGPLRVLTNTAARTTTTTTTATTTTATTGESSTDEKTDPDSAASSAVWIVPMECWYDGSLTFADELCRDFGKWPWVDFQRCVWPEGFPPGDRESSGFRIPAGLVEYFLERNQAQWEALGNNFSSGDSLMTVSHFLPNQRCLPDWVNLDQDDFDLENWLDHGAAGVSAKFARVAGSALLDSQLRSWSSNINSGDGSVVATTPADSFARHIHVFGHSHRPKDIEWRGIRYVHNPMGKPKERKFQMISPTVDFQLLWDTSVGEVRGDPLIRFWEEKGGGKEALWERWDASKTMARKRG